MPSATEIIGNVLDEEEMYRLLSAVAHGHFWALFQLGMRTLENQSTVSWNLIHTSTKAAQKHLRPEGIGYLCAKIANVFTKALYRASYLFDWDTEQLKDILEKNFDRLHFSVAIL